jgi:uncharacterized protein with GYD domain
MPKFLIKASYTTDGVRGLLKEGGTGRRGAVVKLIEGLGGKVESFYYAYGENDAYVITDLPDATSGIALSLAVNASGAVRLSTIPLITPEEIDAACKKSVGYRAPGAWRRFGLLDHDQGAERAGKTELNPAVNAIQSLLVAGRGADMRIALLHNTPAAFHGRPELAEQLTRELTDALRSGRIVTPEGAAWCGPESSRPGCGCPSGREMIGAMKYLGIAYEEERALNALTEGEWHALRQETLDYVAALQRSGCLILAQPLQSATRAATLRVRDGRLSVTDGPFAETKEQIGGFFLFEAASFPEALEVAAKWPSARLGSIEVRPVEEGLRMDRRYTAPE